MDKNITLSESQYQLLLELVNEANEKAIWEARFNPHNSKSAKQRHAARQVEIQDLLNFLKNV